ncbi:Uncharacterized membrane protein [Seinonella peptonophila]|uniref:Uncharacterized membrane protein n=1 Tax=Seinonella peptonophila TaxID=112248 RepID=A0A1M4ZFY2_9BACL|nr:QueT transporter family protein [Seinonella peptonophila]SHF16858.1 Uncharacterized membrane protein [Seinonella peptonophila]
MSNHNNHNTSWTSTRGITIIACIAALYVVLTLNPPLYILSYSAIQIRFSEVLTVLPFLTPLAIPALFIGTFIANLFGTNGLIDAIIGSLATLLAAWLTSKMPNRWLAPLPPVIVNAVIIGAMLGYLSHSWQQAPLFMVQIGISQLLVCYLLGLPFLRFMLRYQEHLYQKK